MMALLRGATQPLALGRAKGILQEQRSSIYSKPPKNKIGAGQSFFIMSVFAVAMLVPAGWIMHHLPEYRKRSRPPP
ncbi:COX8 domain-containing protein [Clupea harengus]|uniref:COX8 domain-containing protein n=1 Tax=Clupea harengus TaxID=7950 RepID=A0A6P3VRH7_CLUHA|nr:COX8 domain-containing protein [Clupea harengus]